MLRSSCSPGIANPLGGKGGTIIRPHSFVVELDREGAISNGHVDDFTEFDVIRLDLQYVNDVIVVHDFVRSVGSKDRDYFLVI